MQVFFLLILVLSVMKKHLLMGWYVTSTCYLSCNSIPATTCLLTNEVGLAPVSNRVGTGSDEELLLMAMQHVQAMTSMSSCVKTGWSTEY